jgi:deoxyribonuclease-4
MTAHRDERFLFGCHLSIAGGFPGAIAEAEELGNDALQLFSHAPSAWRMKELSDEIAGQFRDCRARSSIEFLAVHTMYLLNLASPHDELFERSVDALIEEVRRAGLLGADALVTHLGAHVGSGREAGISRIVGALDRLIGSSVWAEASGVRLLLENTAGSGTTIGSSLDELEAILAAVADATRIGICFDTCHAFAAGCDLRTREAVDATLRQFDRVLGLSRLEMIHLNDSRFPLGSRRDRHAHIGRGEIGAAGIGAVVRHRSLRDTPFVLETPKMIDGRPDADRVNLATVRRLRTQEEAP